MGVKERIIEFIEHQKITTRSFERNSGLSNGYVQRFKGNIGAEKLELILNAYPSLNRAWLLTGVGQMLKPAKNPFSQLTEQEIEDVAADRFTAAMIRLYENGEIYSAAVHNKIVAEKDKRIEELQREVWEWMKKVDELSK